MFAEALKGLKAELGPDHAFTLGSMNNLAQAYRDADRLGDALPLFEETLKLSKAKLGPDHPYALGSMNNLGLAYRDAGRYEAARELFEEALSRSKTALGADHLDSLWAMSNLAQAYADVGRLADSTRLCEDVLKQLRTKLGAGPPRHPGGNGHPRRVLRGQRANLDAIKLYEVEFQGLKIKLGRDHSKTLTAMNNLASSYLRTGKPAAAELLMRRALPLRESKTRDHWRTFETRVLLGASLLEQKKVRRGRAPLA